MQKLVSATCVFHFLADEKVSLLGILHLPKLLKYLITFSSLALPPANEKVFIAKVLFRIAS